MHIARTAAAVQDTLSRKVSEYVPVVAVPYVVIVLLVLGAVLEWAPDMVSALWRR